MKKLKNMVAVIVCLSVMLTVPAHAQLTSTEHGWLESIKILLLTLRHMLAIFVQCSVLRSWLAILLRIIQMQYIRSCRISSQCFK